jgi:predicted MFS family arabinose efflux permease
MPRASKEAKAEAPGRYFAELAEGMRFIWNQRVLRAVVLTVLITNLLDAPFTVVMSVFARDEFGSAADLGLMYGVFGGFALAGALAFSAFGHRLPRRLTFVCCFVVVPTVYLTMATLPSLPIALVALAAAGLAAGPLNPLLVTVEYELVPRRLRGRAFGAVKAGAWAAIPVGVLLGSVLVEVIGLAPTFLGIGACYLAGDRVWVLQSSISGDGSPLNREARDAADCRGLTASSPSAGPIFSTELCTDLSGPNRISEN